MNPQPAIVNLVSDCLRTLPGIANGLVVAVSGGPDSVALLRAVVAEGPPLGCRNIVVAHLNHQLRGTESDRDEAFVAEVQNQLTADVPELQGCHERMDVASIARAEGENLEAAARRLRYRWLAEVARDNGILWVATGHTADDQAETVLHRLLRGTGLQGLRGIAARRELEPGIGLVRPLLPVTRAEVLSYLASLGQAYCVDASNDDPRFTRNRLRNELLPLLAEQYNPGIVPVLGRLAAQAEDFFQEEDQSAGELLRQAEHPRAGDVVVLDRSTLATAPHWLIRSTFRRIWRREAWPMDTMNFAAWDRLAGVAIGEIAALDLPGGVRARARNAVVQLSRVKESQQ